MYSTNNHSSSMVPMKLSPHLRVLESIGLVLVFVASVFLNLTTCVIIARDRLLRSRPTNVCVANLCISNMVLTVFVIPFSLTTLFTDKHDAYSGPACTANGFFSVASCSAIVLTLCCISIDRYIAVTKPTRYRTILTTRRALLMILLTWVQALLYASFPVLGWSRYQYHPGTLHCSPAWTSGCSLYIFLSTVGFAIPVTVMVYTYIRIFTVIRKHSRKILNLKISFNKDTPGVKSEQTPEKGLDEMTISTFPTTKNTAAEIGTMRNESSEYTVSPANTITHDKAAPMFSSTDNFLLRDPLSRLGCSFPCQRNGSCDLFEETTWNAADAAMKTEEKTSSSHSPNLEDCFLSVDNSMFNRGLNRGQQSYQSRRRPKAMPNTLQSNVRSQRRVERRLPREYKVAKTGLLLLVVFLVLWLPYLVVHSCSTNVHASESVFHFAMWLVYMNGVANPIAYAFSNSSVKAKLKQICCKLCGACSPCSKKVRTRVVLKRANSKDNINRN